MLRLRELRELHGYSVKDMCRILGVDDSRYRKWESGTNGLPLEYSLACCDALHCTLDELAGRTIGVENDRNRLTNEEVEVPVRSSHSVPHRPLAAHLLPRSPALPAISRHLGRGWDAANGAKIDESRHK